MTTPDRLPLLDLADYLREIGLEAQIVAPGVPMPTVEAAAAAMGCAPERIFKSILFQSRTTGACGMAIACGLWRVDARALAEESGLASLRLAPPDVVLTVTGYPAGGTPPVGHRERFPVVVDRRVAEQDWGWAGGGREELLVKIASADIIRIHDARIADVVKPLSP